MSILLEPIKWLLILLDLSVFFVSFKWVPLVKKLLSGEFGHKLRSVPVADDESHRVAAAYKDNLVERPYPGVDSLYDLSKDAFVKYASRPCMGTREFLGQHEGNPKVKAFGPNLKWRTYAEVGTEALKFGAALRSVGLTAAPKNTSLEKLKTPCAFAIFENTCK